MFPPRADTSCKSWLADLRMSQKKLGNGGDSELHIGFSGTHQTCFRLQIVMLREALPKIESIICFSKETQKLTPLIDTKNQM